MVILSLDESRDLAQNSIHAQQKHIMHIKNE